MGQAKIDTDTTGAASDSILVINAGIIKKIKQEATSFLSATASGDGTSTSINIAHGIGSAPAYFYAIAASAAAGNIRYVAADATNIAVHYTIAPASGTNNLSYNIIFRP